jgi:hypothetical protein
MLNILQIPTANFRTFSTWITCFLVFSSLQAQNDCIVPGGQVTEAFSALSIFISTTGSDDLADNPLVAVSLGFNHSYATDALIALESPSGERYILVGDNSNQTSSSCTDGNQDPISFFGRIVRGVGNPANLDFLGGNVTGDYTALDVGGNSNTSYNYDLAAFPFPNGDLDYFNQSGSQVSGRWRLLIGCVCAAFGSEQFDVTYFSLHFQNDSEIDCSLTADPAFYRMQPLSFNHDSLERCEDLLGYIDSLGAKPSHTGIESWFFYVENGLVKYVSVNGDVLDDANGSFDLYTYEFESFYLLSSQYENLRNSLSGLYNQPVSDIDDTFVANEVFFSTDSIPRHVELSPISSQFVRRILRENDTLELLSNWTVIYDELPHYLNKHFIDFFQPVSGECDSIYKGVFTIADYHLDTSVTIHLADTFWYIKDTLFDYRFQFKEGDTADVLVVNSFDSIGFVLTSSGSKCIRLESTAKIQPIGFPRELVLEIDFDVLQPFAPTDPDGNGRVDWRDVLYTAWSLGVQGSARTSVSSRVDSIAYVLPWQATAPISGLNSAYADVNGDGVVDFADVNQTSYSYGSRTIPSEIILKDLPSSNPSSTVIEWRGSPHPSDDSLVLNLKLIEDAGQIFHAFALALLSVSEFEFSPHIDLLHNSVVMNDSIFLIFSKVSSSTTGSHELGHLTIAKSDLDSDPNEPPVTTLPLLCLTAEEQPIEVTVNVEGLVSSSKSINSDWNVTAYPNPSNGQLTITWPVGAQRLQVFDLLGRTISDFALQQDQRARSIELPPGRYTISVSNGEWIMQSELVEVR